jgi:hypothetical protein
MKIAGKEIKGPNAEVIILPRGTGEPIVLTAHAILDYGDFDKICPRPEPPTVMRRGGKKTQNVEDPRFKTAIVEYGRRRVAWMVLTSLRLGTPELEWDTVDFGNAATWLNYETELQDSGFSYVEVQRIVNGVMAANCLDDDKLEEARKNFLASLEEPEELSFSQTDEQPTTPSGEPAND